MILSSSNPGDLVLDPFFGSGTTGAVAKKLKRDYIGIERELSYVQIASKRIESIQPSQCNDDLLITDSRRSQPRVNFSALIETGYLAVGQVLYSRERDFQAVIHADGRLSWGVIRGSIHKVAANLPGQNAHNGWDFWYTEDAAGEFISIDQLRERYRAEHEGEVHGGDEEE